MNPKKARVPQPLRPSELAADTVPEIRHTQEGKPKKLWKYGLIVVNARYNAEKAGLKKYDYLFDETRKEVRIGKVIMQIDSRDVSKFDRLKVNFKNITAIYYYASNIPHH